MFNHEQVFGRCLALSKFLGYSPFNLIPGIILIPVCFE